MDNLAIYIEIASFISFCVIFLWTVRSHVIDIRQSVTELNKAIAQIREYNSKEHREFMKEMNARHEKLMGVISEQTKILAVISSSLDIHIQQDIQKEK